MLKFVRKHRIRPVIAVCFLTYGDNKIFQIIVHSLLILFKIHSMYICSSYSCFVDQTGHLSAEVTHDGVVLPTDIKRLDVDHYHLTFVPHAAGK